MIADIAARQECGEVTVQNIVTPSTATISGTSNGLGGAAADDDTKVDSSSSSDLTSHNSSSNSNTATGSNFGKLVCRKRKSPIVPVVETEIENTTQQNGTTEHTQSHSRGGGGGDSNDNNNNNDDDPILKKAKTSSLDNTLQDSSSLPSQSDDTSLKQISDTNTYADHRHHRQEDRQEAVESFGLISQTADSTNIIIKNDFGSEVLKVSFTEEMWSRLLVPPVLTPDMLSLEGQTNTETDTERASYGVKYNFSLKDKATEAAVDAPEWLVPQVIILLYCTLLYSTLLYSTLLYSTLLYSTLQHSTVLYCTVLYCTVLYCTVLYCTVLYCTVLY